MNPLFVGIDFGTSGCRSCVINQTKEIIHQFSLPLPDSSSLEGHVWQDPNEWENALHTLLNKTLDGVSRHDVSAISINGTSGSVLLCDDTGATLAGAYMYNDANNQLAAEKIKPLAPRESAVHGNSSGLAKCLSLLTNCASSDEIHCLNQSDWLSGLLLERFNVSDENNSLKMGYDIIQRQWPTWLIDLNCLRHLASDIFEPGQIMGNISPGIAKQYALSSDTKIVAGTTDSIAAFIATGCNKVGEAVTSLGSTLVVKVISEQPVFAPEFGVYSHRLGDSWLVGGASNTGGAVLKKFFTQAQINTLTEAIEPDISTGLDYYPLTSIGERFPVNDPTMLPRLTPRPSSDAQFFQGLLEGIARVEQEAYQKLAELGAPYPTRIISMGGGSHNLAWQEIRKRYCGVPVEKATITDAAYGTALLASQMKTRRKPQ